MVIRPVAMETPVHARAVCTRPLLLLLKGLETRLGLVLQVAQWYYSSGVPSLYLLVFYHCIHKSVHFRPFSIATLLPDGMFHWSLPLQCWRLIKSWWRPGASSSTTLHVLVYNNLKLPNWSSLSTNSITTQGCSIDAIGYNFIWLDLL